MKVYYPKYHTGMHRIFATPANDGGKDVSEFSDGEGKPITFAVEFKGVHGAEVSDALGKYLVSKGFAKRTRVQQTLDQFVGA